MSVAREEGTLNYSSSGESWTPAAPAVGRVPSVVGDGSLGNSTKHVRQNMCPSDELIEDSKPLPQVSDPTRYRLYKMLRGSSYLLRDLTEGKGKQRVTTCRFAAISKQQPVTVMHANSRSWFQGLQVCGSVWSCPVCSDKISKTRRDEANQALHYARQNHLHVYMVTMTASHQLGDDLRLLKETMTEAWRKMQRRRDWSDLKGKSVVGTIRALEVTHGANGWHPHFHMIVIASKRIKGSLQALSDAWLTSLQSVGLQASEERGWQVQDADSAGSYIAKFGAAEEIALAGKKRGRNGSRTAFQMLDDYVAGGDLRAGALFREFAIAMKGSQQLIWSAGLKHLVGVDEMTDEDAAGDGEEQPELRGLIGYETWRGDAYERRIGARERRVTILEAADVGSEDCHRAIYKNVTDEELWFDGSKGSHVSRTASAEQSSKSSDGDFGRDPRSGRDQKSPYEQRDFVPSSLACTFTTLTSGGVRCPSSFST